MGGGVLYRMQHASTTHCFNFAQSLKCKRTRQNPEGRLTPGSCRPFLVVVFPWTVRSGSFVSLAP